MKVGRQLLAVLMGVTLAACGTPPADRSPDATPTDAGRRPASASPGPGTPSPSAAPPSAAPTTASDPPPLALESVAAGVTEPISIAPVPDGRLLVNERSGRVLLVDPASGAIEPALDIRDRVLGQREQGLLGLALHPEWPAVERVFVHYTDRSGGTVLSAFAAASLDPLRIDPASETVLLTLDQPYANHNGGQVAFGPDGALYLGLGDGGGGGDPAGNGQNPGTLLGSVLRLDVDTEGDAFAIPSDNPFADGSGGAPEVFLYGLRNPWRFSFDQATGLLWIADVGQNAFEEVTRIDPRAEAGANLGWNVMEASHCYAELDCDTDGLIGPVTEYGRDAGCSITGGFVYRGSAIPGLAGWYLFGDYCSRTVFGIPADVDELTEPRILMESGASISTFGEDAEGELYLADLDGGEIYRLVPGD